MPNLINQDGAGNTFYNYITPVVKGEAGFDGYNFLTYAQTAWGNNNVLLSNSRYYVRLPAPGIETKTGTVSTDAGSWRLALYDSQSTSINWTVPVTTGNSSSNTSQVTSQTGAFVATSPTDLSFKVSNSYSLCGALFSNTFSFKTFYYYGWLREPTFTGNVYPRGFIAFTHLSSAYVRVTTENGTTLTSLSSAANAITSPPIVCTVGTQPSSGSATFTDVVIRDAASPNNPVGKLWNCIDMPATCNVGELWRNNGAHDGDGTASTQDVYLCVMPWGTRKLGMRVWTESVN